MAAKFIRLGLIAALLSTTAACAGFGEGRDRLPVVDDPAPIVSGTMRAYQVRGRWYRPAEQPNYNETGLASWYGPGFDGRATASGERFDQDALTAAHKTLPLPALVEVTNLSNGRRVVLRVNDRGPFVDDRIIDLSRGAAEALGTRSQGLAEVRVRYLGRAPRTGGGQRLGDGPAVQYAETDRPARADGLREAIPAPPSPTETAYLPQAAPVALTPAPTVSGLWVQAASYDDVRRARREADRLGGSARVEAGSGTYRVLVGPWPDPGAAERSRRSVVSRGYPDARLISGG
ncbi:MAG: septal ring lytic transglycosylase RlpA family protein [Brevundimonas sp.]|nr:MAG: septal ring lytic transglycosylase RlpA family protein [Brevundimonas sp.]